MTGRTAIGWPVLEAAQVPAYVVAVAGGDVTMRLRPGDTADLLVDLIKRFDATVEPVYQGVLDDWSYNKRKVRDTSDIWSEHAAGTAIDLNAVRHPRGVRGTFTPAEMDAVNALVDRYEGVIAWGGNFGLPGHTGHTPDEMHWQINVPPGDPAIARVAAKIRALEDELSAQDVTDIKAAIAASEDAVAHKVYDLLTHQAFTGDEQAGGDALDRRPPVQISLVGARATFKALDAIANVAKQLAVIAAATADEATKEQVDALTAEVGQLVADAQPPAPTV